ncbi:PAS domain-containing sensor histidine kinase [Flavobacterium muglaense]|uniref:histidine kinase n=1 Tax=Flavobacterium muglaense TaxID=2764716 RepID=A0A923MWV6_9FLAO|nr:PAS domain-containing protein [Flavobacterium muglaense]MBC5836590.1 PAS domain-containing protein [Flavobacterium muglaense]MBC5843144.1 PAS domain-containing protein [Flavobacterium muglaense]
MKNKSNQITAIYLLIAIFAAIIFHKISLIYSKTTTYPIVNFIKDVTLVLITGLTYRFILVKNDNRNLSFFEKLKRTNDKIRESNEKYDIVAKATSDTIWDWQIQQDQLIWNKGIKSMFGYDENQIGNSSKWWFDNIHPEDSIKMSIKLYSFIEQKTENWQDEYRFKCSDNSYKYVLDRGFLLKDENGKPTRMIGAIQDITKRKEEELRLKLLETVILQTKDSIVISEADFNKNKLPKIIYVNPAFSTITGYKASEVIGESPDLLKGINTDPINIQKIVDTIKNREESVFEMICYKKNNEEFWLSFSMIPIYNADKELSHWISIQRDITNDKKQEKEKEQLINELTITNKDLKQFSYITSHNLRAPLSNLTGLLNLVEDIEIEDLELKEIIHGFSQSTHLLNDTINDLTRVMLIKDKPSIQREEVVLKDVFKKIYKITTATEGQKPLVVLDTEQAPVLYINKPYIESILQNLLSNSIKYRSTDKELKISIKSFHSNNSTYIVFEDNGIGIDLKRNKDKIFGLYQKFHNQPNSKGLGLYLVKSQVEAMEGSINVTSTVNIGTTFTITFKNK